MTLPPRLKGKAELPLVKGAVILILAYWAVYAVVVPVTVWDSQTYNLARLEIARFGGLFGNTSWNSDRQVAFPWAFDAIHYPFLRLGWGYALPSFCCFVGVILIVFSMVKTRFGKRSAWYCCLAMLALPTLVFQATSTKNDVAVVFGVACWSYALWRLQNNDSRGLLFLSALALSFAAGAKSSGIPLLILLAIVTIWRLRHDWHSVGWFLACLLLCVILFGGGEIYVNNWMTYRHPLGPLQIRRHQNPDGISGMLANFIRYAIGSINLGFDFKDPHSPITTSLADLCRAVLKVTGLENKGYRWDFNDSNMELLKTGGEGGSDFGPFGTFSCLTAGFILLGRPTKDILWRIAAAGLASMLLVCATTSWMPWNMRFLLLPFLLFSLVTVILFTSETAAGTQGRIVLLALLLFSAVAFPLYSLNKGPKDLWLSVKDRRAMITKERSAMLEILQDLEARQAEIGSAPILLSAGDDSWVLPILQLRNLHVIPFPQIDRPRLRQFSSQQGRLSVYILTLNRPLGPDCHAVPVKTYGEQDSALFSWPVLEPIATLNSQTNALTFVFASGWHQVEYDGQDWSCWTDGRGRVMVQAARDMVVALTGEIHSAQRPNHVDVLVNGAKVDTLTINWTEWAFHPFSPVRVEFKAGENFMDFVSQNPAVTLQHDPRSLAIAVRNLAFATEK